MITLALRQNIDYTVNICINRPYGFGSHSLLNGPVNQFLYHFKFFGRKFCSSVPKQKLVKENGGETQIGQNAE